MPHPWIPDHLQVQDEVVEEDTEEDAAEEEAMEGEEAEALLVPGSQWLTFSKEIRQAWSDTCSNAITKLRAAHSSCKENSLSVRLWLSVLSFYSKLVVKTNASCVLFPSGGLSD